MNNIKNTIQSVVDSVSMEIVSRGMPHAAFSVKPIVFSGNYTGHHSQKNPPVYGFEVICLDAEYKDRIGAVFSILHNAGKLKPLHAGTSGSCVASYAPHQGNNVSFGASKAQDVIETLNRFILSENNKIRSNVAQRDLFYA